VTSGTAVPATRFVIAVDGPSGTGKSTVSRRVATALRAGYLDTGAMYRLVALSVLDAGVDPADEPAVTALLPAVVLDTPVDPAQQRHVLGGRDVTDEIRGGAVTLAVTPVSANPAVRAFLKDRQQELAHAGRMVVEGRDIGTVIAPDATLKIYLTADAAERARRRYGQDGRAADLQSVAADLQRRDDSDSARAHAPLQAAADAVLVDSSGFEIEDTVARILDIAAAKGIS
jgi:CMP/dCMP kinase